MYHHYKYHCSLSRYNDKLLYPQILSHIPSLLHILFPFQFSPLSLSPFPSFLFTISSRVLLHLFLIYPFLSSLLFFIAISFPSRSFLFTLSLLPLLFFSSHFLHLDSLLFPSQSLLFIISSLFPNK